VFTICVPPRFPSRRTSGHGLVNRRRRCILCRYLSLACLLHDEMGMPFWLEQTEEVMRRLDT